MRKVFSYANVAATMALVVAIAGGAYAITVDGGDVRNGSLTGRDLKSDSVPEKDLNFDALRPSDSLLDGRDTTNDTTVSGDTPGYVTIFTNSFRLERKADVLALGSLTLENNEATQANVEFQMLLDGELHHEFEMADELGPGESELDSFSLQCNLVPAGNHSLELQIDTGGANVTITSRSLNLVSMQDIH